MRRFRIATAVAAGLALAAMVAPAASQAAESSAAGPSASAPADRTVIQAHWFFYASYNTLYTCNFVGGWLETQRLAQDHYCTAFTSNGTQYWALYVYA